MNTCSTCRHHKDGICFQIATGRSASAVIALTGGDPYDQPDAHLYVDPSFGCTLHEAKPDAPKNIVYAVLWGTHLEALFGTRAQAEDYRNTHWEDHTGVTIKEYEL